MTMATASNAQREPSMEEILASIRRIIEDNDTGRKPVETFSGTSDVETEITEDTPPAVVDVFRSELRSASSSEPLKVPSSPPAFAKIDFAQAETSRPSAQMALKPVDASDRLAGAVDPFAPAEPVDKKMETSGKPTDVINAMPLSKSAHEQKPEPELAAAILNSPLPSEMTEPGRSTLVSEKTSRQVAAAFEELSEAFATRSKKSLEEMAEEMLRPMLQSWLDNNLPTLVEKLVREEIERVARGGYEVQR